MSEFYCFSDNLTLIWYIQDRENYVELLDDTPFDGDTLFNVREWIEYNCNDIVVCIYGTRSNCSILYFTTKEDLVAFKIMWYPIIK